MNPQKKYRIALRVTLALGLALLITWGVLRISAPAAAGTCPTELFISEYIEGSGNNKAIEIYNGTGGDITMTGHYSVALYANGATDPNNTLDLTGVLTNGEVYVIANSSADSGILDEADTTSSVTFFNGNDALVLFKDGMVIDSLGEVGNSAYWGSDTTLVRKSSITQGDTVEDDAFNSSTEWDNYSQDTFTYLGSHTIAPCGPSFSISKSAPATVAPGDVFTYTLTIENATGITPTTTTITDVLPSGVDFIAASDSGSLNAGTVSWTVSDFASGATLTRTFSVTATGTHGMEIENADYGVNGGSDWMTTTTGMTVRTQIVGTCDSIYNIQYPGGDSLCDGETATVEGVVYAVYGSNSFALAENAGAWHGIYVYDSGIPLPEVGDSMVITGTVEEYFGLTQLGSITYSVMSTGTAPYAASVISTATADDGEAYEGVLVEVQDVVVDNPDLGNGEWSVDDGSGPVIVNDLGYAYSATAGEALDAVRGMLNYSYSNYKIEPRDADDVVPFTGTGLVVSKDAPDFVAPGILLTYTINVNNQTGGILTDMIISDTLPLSATYASSNPMGNWDDTTQTITWTAASLAHDTTLTYTLVVTAPNESITLTNDEYVAYATEWTTPTTGSPAATLIRDCNSIYGIQHVDDPGTDDASPCEGQSVSVRGIVYGTYGSSKYFIADAAGPWHGLYIYNGGDVSVGDEVIVSGDLQEYYGVTELYASGETILSSGNVPYGPTIVTAADIPFDDVATSEAYEGVFVETRDITVTATGSYNIWSFTDSSGSIAKADDWSYDADPTVGETFALLRGALAYDFNEYKIMPRSANDVIDRQIALEKTAPANVSPGELYTYTLTVGNYTGAELANIVLTDTVPANTTFAYALDDGTTIQNGNVVSWTVDTLPDFDTFTARFAVTAATSSVLISNDDYTVGATNYPTPTTGTPVLTLIGDEISIHHIQGDGMASPLLGQTVTGVDGIVTSVHAEGFYMQEPNADADPLTSEGIYVYLGSTPSISVGDIVDVDGTVDEYYESTQIASAAVSDTGNDGTIPTTQVTLPETVDGEIERYEGMLVTLPHTMTVAQNYFQGRYGQVTLSTGGRMYQPTHMHEPGSAEYEALLDENMRRMLILDDGTSEQNPDPIPYIGLNNTLRAGDVVSANLTGIIDNGPINSNSPPTVDYRLHPTGEVDIERVNARSDSPPDVGGRLQVASFNVLNYFNGDGMGGGFPTSRGADTLLEFNRQRDKIITAVLALDADVVGLMEIENDGYDANSAIADLVNGLNQIAGSGTYTYVNPGVAKIGDDEIAVGLIYQPGSVMPVGSAAILDDSFDPDYTEDKNRPALAQTFEENATGQKFTAVVNHLKSKGSPCDSIGDPNTGDGQGNCNLTRTSAMSVEISWLATDPTGSGDPDFVILGDLNSYAQEDPIDVARNAGYTDLLWNYVGPNAYSYIFDGQSGYLDYALSNPRLTAQVTGAAVWHINTDEPSVIDYNTEFKSQDFYTTSAYRASDHDPVIIGLDLGPRYYFPLIFKNGN